VRVATSMRSRTAVTTDQDSAWSVPKFFLRVRRTSRSYSNDSGRPRPGSAT
jgi:hypothetical protein